LVLKRRWFKYLANLVILRAALVFTKDYSECHTSRNLTLLPIPSIQKTPAANRN